MSDSRLAIMERFRKKLAAGSANHRWRGGDGHQRQVRGSRRHRSDRRSTTPAGSAWPAAGRWPG